MARSRRRELQRPQSSLLGTSLETARLLLRSPRPSDIDTIYELARGRPIHRFLVLPFPYRKRHAAAWVSKARQENRKGVSYNAVILRRDDRTLLGVTSLLKIHPVHRRAEVGYWLGKSHWRRGYAREAVAALVGFAQRRLRLRKVYAHTMVGNAPSERLLRACGFCEEGLLFSEMKAKGRWRDLKRWARISPRTSPRIPRSTGAPRVT